MTILLQTVDKNNQCYNGVGGIVNEKYLKVFIILSCLTLAACSSNEALPEIPAAGFR